jgi:hypothetical protein
VVGTCGENWVVQEQEGNFGGRHRHCNSEVQSHPPMHFTKHVQGTQPSHTQPHPSTGQYCRSARCLAEKGFVWLDSKKLQQHHHRCLGPLFPQSLEPHLKQHGALPDLDVLYLQSASERFAHRAPGAAAAGCECIRGREEACIHFSGRAWSGAVKRIISSNPFCPAYGNNSKTYVRIYPNYLRPF